MPQDRYYPTYCLGAVYITTPATARRLVGAANVTQLFWIDDVWVTGYLAARVGVNHQAQHTNIYGCS